MKYLDGTKYVGEFKDGKMHGKGICTYADGSSMKCEWNNGEFVE